jgi:general stress protein YciG
MATKKKKNAAAVELGRKGGQRSRVNLSPERRTEIAKRAAAARWKKPEAPKGE